MNLKPLPLALLLLSVGSVAQAATGKLVLTGGVSTIEGAGGGALTPWAMVGSNATEGEIGVAASISYARTNDYRLESTGITLGWNERVELSLGRQSFDTGITGRALLRGQDLTLEQTIVGAKVRLFGDAILDSDRWMPAVAVGVQHKRLDGGQLEGTLQSLGASTRGTDFYVSATKLFLKQGVLVNGTLRATEANQNGLLGFGANGSSGHAVMPEFSVAKLLSNNLAVGAEYRFMPDRLRRAGGDGLAADDWKNVFVAWAPSKHLSVAAAYVDLGRIVPATTNGRDQTGFYVSAQLAF